LSTISVIFQSRLSRIISLNPLVFNIVFISIFRIRKLYAVYCAEYLNLHCIQLTDSSIPLKQNSSARQELLKTFTTLARK